MFNRKRNVTIITRFVNEDNLKITKLIRTYREPGILEHIVDIDKDKVMIKFTTDKACVRGLIDHINLLKFIGIEAEMTIEK